MYIYRTELLSQHSCWLDYHYQVFIREREEGKKRRVMGRKEMSDKGTLKESGKKKKG